ncbi:MAG: hypothetical protein KIT22_03125 [Verrucomicrobiae bacterium]|nr:hypothetical protein [Verrucomicrobiae bacterium]
MNKRRYLWVVIGIVLAGLFVVEIRRHINAGLSVFTKLNVENRSDGIKLLLRIPEVLDTNHYARWAEMKENGAFMTNKLVQEYVSSKLRDPGWDWRRSISFWGIVVDDADVPIGNADVELIWTDESPKGTSTVNVNRWRW